MQKGGGQNPLMDYALYLLSRQRYTVAEMHKKLSARIDKLCRLNKAEPGIKTGELEKIPAVVARLQELKLLNDEEFAQLYIHDQLLRKPQGLRLLRQSMARKGLPKEIILQAINGIADDPSEKELELAARAAAKKLKTMAKTPPQKRREKLARFLTARGFPISITIKVVNSKLGETEG